MIEGVRKRSRLAGKEVESEWILKFLVFINIQVEYED